MLVPRFLLVACFWGGSFIAIEPLVKIVPPLTAGAMRILVSLIFLCGLFPLLGVSLRAPRVLLPKLWLTGCVAFAIPFALLFWGEQSVSPGLAGILNGTVPIWVFVLGALLTPGAEPIRLRQVVGLLIGVSGVLAIFLPRLLSAETDSSLLGAVAVTLMAVSYASGVLLNRSIFSRFPQLHPFTNLFQQQCAGGVVLLLVALIFEGLPHPSEWNPLSTVFLAELYLGVGSTSIAFVLFYRIIREWGSVRAATVTYVVPAAALGFDLIINHHLPRASEWVGVLAITAGVVILNLPSSRARI